MIQTGRIGGVYATKKLIIPGLCLVLLLEVCLIKAFWGESVVSVMSRHNHAENRSSASSSDDTAKRDLLALMMAYPGTITGLEKSDGGAIYVVMRSGKKILYDDKKSKTYEQKLAAPDLQDMMEQDYPLSFIDELLKGDLDPGRIRVYGFFEEVYGATKAEISKNLVNVSVGPRNCLFNKNNDAAPALKAAFVEVSSLVQSDPDIYAFVYPMGGTFNYRVVAGTNRLSMHSYGIAVDLKLDNYDYWKFATRAQGQKRLESYPRSLVKIFENHGFIWGGKWAHFDIVHYEYRPELIIKSKYQTQENNPDGPWYGGYPDTESVRSYIGLIENALN